MILSENMCQINLKGVVEAKSKCIYYITRCGKSMNHREKHKEPESNNQYTYEDAMKVADDIFKLSKDNEYHPGAFVHGLVFALEATQQSYKIPPKQIAEVKRSTRKYLQQVEQTLSQQKKE